MALFGGIFSKDKKENAEHVMLVDLAPFSINLEKL